MHEEAVSGIQRLLPYSSECCSVHFQCRRWLFSDQKMHHISLRERLLYFNPLAFNSSITR